MNGFRTTPNAPKMLVCHAWCRRLRRMFVTRCRARRIREPRGDGWVGVPRGARSRLGRGFASLLRTDPRGCLAGHLARIGRTSPQYARTPPVPVRGFVSAARSMAAGYVHTCATDSASAVWCWGENTFGQLGTLTTENASVPTRVPELTAGVTALVAGSNHTCALTSTGGVVCWGSNTYGNLGFNSTESQLPPRSVVGLESGVVALAAGAQHTCALSRSGGVSCWAGNEAGQLGTGTRQRSRVPTQVVGLSSGVVALAAGSEHTCAVTAAGRVLCWGNNADGQPHRPRVRPHTRGLCAGA